MEILNVKDKVGKYLGKLDNYDDLKKFFNFLIKVKNVNSIRKDDLYKALLLLTEDLDQDSIQYAILTDTMDYFVGHYSVLKENSDEYFFVKSLNS
ncbi:hypothetical protein [Acinetobacter sp. ESBL14]|uniref:hypothetical protein n=1 Tax=Acinetobacter sp. ESBL14 TaxID=3077329 RepID=UPI002FC73C40